MRLVLVGPPGSGKGTQAERLVKHFNLTAVGTGAMFRDHIERGTAVGKKAEALIREGRLVDDTIVNDMVAELFRSPARPNCFAMDGYPRTYSQAVAFDALLTLEHMALDAVVNLTISDDEVVRRIGGRICCSNVECGVCYHSVARPPKAPGTCDACGSPLVIREDDKEETIRRRLCQFHANTDAMLEHYRKKNLVDDISAVDHPDAIFQNILKALDRRQPGVATKGGMR